MIPDVRFEADFLRSALLLGKVREPEVCQWADALLAAGAEPIALLTDVALALPKLTPLREALLPLAAPSHQASLAAAVLAFLATDADAVAMTVSDRIRVLGQLRREDILAPGLATAIKEFEDRVMLASAGIGIDVAIAIDLERWLASVRAATYYRICIADAGERAAFLGALSRKIVRDRRLVTSPFSAMQAWITESTSVPCPTVVLNVPLWQVAVAAFSPLPLASRIPYGAMPDNAVLILDEASIEPMSARAAADHLAAV